jgi:hypothetical protein
VTNGSVIFRNHGELLSQADFQSPLVVSGRFKFTGNPYDSLNIAIRTSGTHLDPRFYENGFMLTVAKQSDDGSKQNLIRITKNGVIVTDSTYSFSLNQFYEFKITDDGTNMDFYFGDLMTPLVSVTDTNKFGNKVGISNREGSSGGSGISNGSEVQIDFLRITSDFENFCAPRPAKATAIWVNGFVVEANVTDGGCGYTNTPLVLIQGGGGSSATAEAVVSNNIVVGVKIISAGCCYTNFPKIIIAAPPFVPSLNISVSKVKVVQNVNLGRRYLLESSIDMIHWIPVGQPFTATSESVSEEFDVTEIGRHFKLREVP